MMRILRYSVGDHALKIGARVALCGPDVVVVVGGGGLPHVGAVSVATAHPDLKDSSRQTATASVIAIEGHREDEIARAAALHLAKAFNTTVVVSVGIHIDNATPEQIEALVGNYHQLISAIEVGVGAYFIQSGLGTPD
jgi:hypothetical protein